MTRHGDLLIHASHCYCGRSGSSYGYATDTIAWDADIMHGCLCDSSWEVSYGAHTPGLCTGRTRSLLWCSCQVGLRQHETQLAEYFGADCSMRKCGQLKVKAYVLTLYGEGNVCRSPHVITVMTCLPILHIFPVFTLLSCLFHCNPSGRCPSGENPHTSVRETDCEGKNQSPYGKLSTQEI